MPKWNAKEYEKYSSGQTKWGEELLKKLNLKGNEYVLDTGCGDGKITYEISLLVPDGFVKGIDNSISMINNARSKYPVGQFPNLSFELMNVKAIKLKDQFDVVFSNAALHWVDDHSKVLRGIYNSLKPGGKILLQMGGKGNASAAFGIINEMASMRKWSPYLKGIKSPYHFFSNEEYKSFIQEAGFTPVRIELIKKDMVHEGKKGFEGFIRTTWLPFTERIPEKQREEFISEAAGLYLKKHPLDRDGKVHIGMVRLEVEAKK